ncbi:MAG: hypothetical protein A2173_09185 [Planctomycetes bacterium RBG_13_44_8b]|nr:MAG: hypothetical protein A2173_09185 [Planctomycetes bacterium RBG_13_44_8b]
MLCGASQSSISIVYTNKRLAIINMMVAKNEFWNSKIALFFKTVAKEFENERKTSWLSRNL